MASAHWELRQSSNGQDLHLEVVGPFTFDQADEWGAMVREVWSRRPAQLLVDLSRTPYLDTSGVALLVSAASRTRRRGICFKISGLSLPARRVLRLTRLDDYFQNSQTSLPKPQRVEAGLGGETTIKNAAARWTTLGSWLLLLLAILVSPVQSQSQEDQFNRGTEVVRQVRPSVALILAGEGGGRLTSIGSGLIVGVDGTILTAHHLIRDAREVQVRLYNGDVYDEVDLVGVDERRDVAALRITGQNLPVLRRADPQSFEPGSTVYAVSNPSTLSWTVSAGIVSALRRAEEVEGAGEGYQLIQFTAPVSPGSSGGVLVDAQANVLGLVTISVKGQNNNFAVPLNSVLGLAEGAPLMRLGKGKDLQLPAVEEHSPAAAAVVADPKMIVEQTRTVYVRSRNEFFTPEPLESELQNNPEFKKWGFMIVADPRAADLVVEVDRPLFTWDFTFSIVHPRSSVSLGTGKVIAWDGVRAAPQLAKKIVAHLKALRSGPLPQQQANNSGAGEAKE